MGWRDWWYRHSKNHSYAFRGIQGQPATPHALSVQRTDNRVLFRIINILEEREVGWIALEKELTLKHIEKHTV